MDLPNVLGTFRIGGFGSNISLHSVCLLTVSVLLVIKLVKISQREIPKAAGVTEVTVRSRLSDLKAKNLIQ
jgi:transcription initiation factor TFIIIB Brf1 subunit/transcription initiation factor TFIIB